MNGYFGAADAPWLPTVLDIERLKADGDVSERLYYSRFGFDQLEVPETAVHVSKRFRTLEQRFMQVYGWRQIGYETLEQWQVKLQEIMDANVDRFERAYALYETNRDAMMTDVLPGRKVTTLSDSMDGGKDSRKDVSDSNDTVKGRNRSSDTPDSRINESDDYAGEISLTDSTSIGKRDTESTTSYGRTNKVNISTTEQLTGTQILQAVNISIDDWRDIDTAFVGEFGKVFLNIFWY